VSTSLRGLEVSCTLFCRWHAHDGSPGTLEEVFCGSGEKSYLAKKEVASRVNEEYAVLEVFRLEMRNWEISWVVVRRTQYVADIVVIRFNRDILIKLRETRQKIMKLCHTRGQHSECESRHVHLASEEGAI
jgi:hypothetical protein